jgi:excisionase family DNA binding protein
MEDENLAILPELLTPEMVAQYLGVNVRTVNKLARDGKLPYVQVTPKKRRFIKDQVIGFVEQKTHSMPKILDQRTTKRLPSPQRTPKGGCGKESFGDSVKTLRKEMSEWQ